MKQKSIHYHLGGSYLLTNIVISTLYYVKDNQNDVLQYF